MKTNEIVSEFLIDLLEERNIRFYTSSSSRLTYWTILSVFKYLSVIHWPFLGIWYKTKLLFISLIGHRYIDKDFLLGPNRFCIL